MLAEKKIYGLIGQTLGHSFSRDFFTQKFLNEGINAEYLNFELPDINFLMELLAEEPALMGFNVTIPYKEQIIPFLTGLSPEAAEIGAVNVVKVIRDAADPGNILRLVGHNTDYAGFADSMRPLLGPSRDKALVLGTGGASKAVSLALRNMGVAVQPVSRTEGDGVLTYAQLTPEVMASHRVIVNATPLGMYPDVDSCPDIPYDELTPEHLCYDLLYNPPVTLFMERAEARGAETKNGLEMLMLQAFASWDIWNRPAD